ATQNSPRGRGGEGRRTGLISSSDTHYWTRATGPVSPERLLRFGWISGAVARAHIGRKARIGGTWSAIPRIPRFGRADLLDDQALRGEVVDPVVRVTGDQQRLALAQACPVVRHADVRPALKNRQDVLGLRVPVAGHGLAGF